MIIVSFELTMPNRGSWNGRWSGEDKKYYLIKKFTQREINAKHHLQQLQKKGFGGWYYRWEDGWGASVDALVVDAKTAARMRKVSSGFCGYEWMVESIIKRDRILASHQIKQLENEPTEPAI